MSRISISTRGFIKPSALKLNQGLAIEPMCQRFDTYTDALGYKSNINNMWRTGEHTLSN